MPTRYDPLPLWGTFPHNPEIGFCVAEPGHDWSALHLDHTSHHKWVVETALSSGDDEVIADVLSVWVICGNCIPPGFLYIVLPNMLRRINPSPQGYNRWVYALLSTLGAVGLGILG